MWPSRIAVQISVGCSSRDAWITAQRPSGTTICETIEMYSGDRVSPVPWSPPVYVSATVTKSPDTLRNLSSCTPSATTDGSVMPKSPRRARGIARNSTPIAAARPSPIPAATWTPCTERSGRCAPRFCPATVAAAPISPTEVHVMNENSSV